MILLTCSFSATAGQRLDQAWRRPSIIVALQTLLFQQSVRCYQELFSYQKQVNADYQSCYIKVFESHEVGTNIIPTFKKLKF